MFILFNQMFCSRTNVLNKAGAARTLRALADRPKPSPRLGVAPALRFSILKYFPWNLKRGSRFSPLLLRCHCTCFHTIPSHQPSQLASSCHRFRRGDVIMIKQVIMQILVIEEPRMTRRDNRPYFQKNSTDDCLTTVKLAAKLRNTER